MYKLLHFAAGFFLLIIIHKKRIGCKLKKLIIPQRKKKKPKEKGISHFSRLNVPPFNESSTNQQLSVYRAAKYLA